MTRFAERGRELDAETLRSAGAHESGETPGDDAGQSRDLEMVFVLRLE